MPVDSQHPSYQSSISKWNRIRAVIEGEDAVKELGQSILPKQENFSDLEYSAYLARAVFYSVTSRVLEGLLGLMFRNPIDVGQGDDEELPEELAYLLSDSDGNGMPLEQSIKQTTADVISMGRFGLLVDMPLVDEGAELSLAQEEELGILPRILLYLPESILNWKAEKVGGITVLTMVILREFTTISDPEDQYKLTEVEVYRELLINPDTGIYEVNTYQKIEGEITKTNEQPIIPVIAGGTPLTRIPFQFVGSRTMNADIDKPPMMDLALMNLAHFRNSADVEDAAFMIGKPTPWAAGLTQSWIEKVWKKEIVLGSRSILALPEGGEVGLLESQSDKGFLTTTRDEKYEKMVALGARFLEFQKAGVEAAETQRQRYAADQGIMANAAGNVSDAYTWAVNQCARFLGNADPQMSVQLPTEFLEEVLTPQEALALISLFSQGMLARSDIHSLLQRAKFLDKDRSLEELLAEVNSDLPSSEGDEDEIS